MSEIRLFINEEKFFQKQRLEIAGKDFDYLVKVMRRKVGDEISLFNNRDGQWVGEIVEILKKKCVVEVVEKVRDFYQVPNSYF